MTDLDAVGVALRLGDRPLFPPGTVLVLYMITKRGEWERFRARVVTTDGSDPVFPFSVRRCRPERAGGPFWIGWADIVTVEELPLSVDDVPRYGDWFDES